MPAFAYQARDQQGRLVRGILEAKNPVSLAEHLRRMGYLVSRMDPVSVSAQKILNLRWGRAVSPEGLLLAVIQLANLVEAGVPLIASLQSVASQAGSPSLREALEAVCREVEGGTPFSQALSHQPPVFPKLMVSLVSVGEASGHLDAVLARFASFLEKDLALTRAVRGALLYPALLLTAAAGLVLFVVTFVVPQFASLFARAGIGLPTPTRILQAIGEAIRTRWLLLLGLVGVALGGIGWALRIPAVRFRIDQGLLKLPVIGPSIHQAVVARFARTLATLVSSGVPIVGALETAEGVVENQVIVQELRRVRTAVVQGERIAATLAVSGVFHPDAIQMIRVGEEAGRLDAMLEKIADFYELQVNYRLRQMTTLLEPILLVAMGGVVAFIMASLLLPMFDMVKVLQRGGFR